MKFKLLSAATPDFPYAINSMVNKQSYCERHGYELIWEWILHYHRTPSWEKILFCEQHLEDCEWLVWTDADTLITNANVTLETFVNEENDLIISRDVNGINSGIFFLRNCGWSRTFLSEVWALPDAEPKSWWEQSAIMQLLQNQMYSSRTKIVTNQLFNAYPASGYSWPDKDMAWKQGDFLIHFPGENEPWGMSKDQLMEIWYAQLIAGLL